MANYGKFITNIIHNNNHIRTNYNFFINNSNIIKNKYINLENNKTHIYRDIEPGLYKLSFENDDNEYIIDIFHPINTKGQRIVINNKNDIQYRTVCGCTNLRLYRIMESDAINNSINSFFDIIAFEGNSHRNSSNYNINNPSKIYSINNTSLHSYGNNKEDYLYIDFRHEIRSLPNNISDVCILDAEQNKAYIIRSVGHMQLSGNDENIIEIPTLETSTCKVFFVENKLAKFIDSKDALLCSCLDSVSYSDIIKKEYNNNAVALSNDYKFRHEGFYFKINKNIAPTLSAFKSIINNNYTSNSPIEILYPLIIRDYLPLILDKYRLKTYFNHTELITDSNVSYGYKTI